MKRKFEPIVHEEINIAEQLKSLCSSVRALVEKKRYDDCLPLIRKAMEEYPHAPQPHNLLGVVLEKMRDHLFAMKHFRAAWALDPTYMPASHNLNVYGTFFSGGFPAFDESDLPTTSERTPNMLYGGGNASKSGIECDKRGIGHAVRR